MTSTRLPLLNAVIRSFGSTLSTTYSLRTRPITLQQPSRQYSDQQLPHDVVETGSSDMLLNPFSKVDKMNKQYLEELRPPAKRSFNFAAYINNSETLQELVKLGVSLYDIENFHPEAARLLLKLDFNKDCVPYIKFLVDVGVAEKNLGRFISEFPMIFSEHIDDLQTRINYLKSKRFTDNMITALLNKSSVVLSNKTKTVDYKLGELQIEFKLPANILRNMVVTHPTIISHPNEQYQLINFTLHDEFGFRTKEIHSILRFVPEVIDLERPILIDRLDLLHNTLGFPHKTIANFPRLIVGPKLDIEYRFRYLEKLKRNQFDPELPLYVPPTALYKISDETFCTKYAKTSLTDFIMFLKCR